MFNPKENRKFDKLKKYIHKVYFFSFLSCIQKELQWKEEVGKSH